ncbi:hypothetical protein S245_036480, partial [Arachis hypogaea]
FVYSELLTYPNHRRRRYRRFRRESSTGYRGIRGCAGVVAYRPPRKVARIVAPPEASGSDSPLALVRTVERTPPAKAYASPESYLSPAIGKLPGQEVSGSCKELSPQCFGGGGRRSEKVDEEKENGMWHGLSGRFPSVSLFNEYQNAAMACVKYLIADDFSAELADGLAYVAGHDEESTPVLKLAWLNRIPLSISLIALLATLNKFLGGMSKINLKLSWPLSTREAIVHDYLFEYYQDDLVVVLLNSVSDSKSITGFNSDVIPDAKDAVRSDVVGGFALQKYLRSYSNGGSKKLGNFFFVPAFHMLKEKVVEAQSNLERQLELIGTHR